MFFEHLEGCKILQLPRMILSWTMTTDEKWWIPIGKRFVQHHHERDSIHPPPTIVVVTRGVVASPKLLCYRHCVAVSSSYDKAHDSSFDTFRFVEEEEEEERGGGRR